jgi:hypothetical protein
MRDEKQRLLWKPVPLVLTLCSKTGTVLVMKNTPALCGRNGVLELVRLRVSEMAL